MSDLYLKNKSEKLKYVLFPAAELFADSGRKILHMVGNIV